MAIEREDIDRQKVDFSDVASGRRLPPVHPGEILRDEFLTPLDLSVSQLAQEMKVADSQLTDIVLGRRAITTDTAQRLGRYFETTPEFWINLQTHYDLDGASHAVGFQKVLDHIRSIADSEAQKGRLFERWHTVKAGRRVKAVGFVFDRNPQRQLF